MAKNITIREGDTAKQFTAKKLKMNLVGGGTANFVPEDEAVDYVDLKDHEFKANGTFNPSDFNCDGFGQVKVNVPANVKEKTITKNGVFNAVDDNCLGYSKVTVNVPGGGGGGPYTVKFFGDDYETVLKTEANVPYGGSASCTELDGTILNGLYFKGWNPAPSNVRDNMNCYPVRGDYQIDENEIQDSWETICADKGAHYPLGSYKSLVVTIPSQTFETTRKSPNDTEYTWNISIPQENVAMHMVKVAEGEDGSKSSWISTGGILRAVYGFTTMSNTELTQKMSFDWGNSLIREWLNSVFISYLPQSLRDSIKTVDKMYNGALSYNPQNTDLIYKSSLDKIWLISAKELHTALNDYTVRVKNSDVSFSSWEEPQGIDYSSIYVPTYQTGIYILRSASSNQWSAAYNYTYLAAVVESSHRIEASPHLGGDADKIIPFGFCL